MIKANKKHRRKLVSLQSMNKRIATLCAAVLIGIGGCAVNEQDTSDKNTDENSNSKQQYLGVQAWPAPQSPVQTSAELEGKISALLAQMSLEEKVGQILQPEIQSITPAEVKKFHIGSILNGGGSVPYRTEKASVSDWLKLADEFYQASMDTSDGGVAIPVIWGTDAVHGVGNLYGATLYPHNIGLGAANNPELIRRIGAATARVVRATGIEWTFAPTLAVVQDDRWGRTYESYSEVPQRVKKLGAAMIDGLQGKAGSDDFLGPQKVLATAKHFLADGGTADGNDQGDAIISEKELIAIHNPGYVSALEAGVQTVMASFSSWNGMKMHGNDYLLTDVLKQRMGFDGLVVGDWNGHGQVPGCTNDSCAAAVNAGIDLLMVPYDWKNLYYNTLKQARQGTISSARLDDAVRRILRVKFRINAFAAKPSERAVAGDQSVVGSAQHRAIAREAVRETLVLLKNNKHLLPLNPRQRVLVAGDGANSIAKQSGGWSVTWQGAGLTNDQFPAATSIYAGIRQAVESQGGSVELLDADRYSATAVKKTPDVAIVVFGEDPYAEGQGDLNTLEFEAGHKNSLALLKSLQAAAIPTVSVFLSGRPLWVNPEINASQAFVAAWLPGTEGAGVADVIIAAADGKPRYDFKGKLSFSWPRLPTQNRLNPHHPDYDPLFPLDYGLRYAVKTGADEMALLPEKVEGLTSSKTQDIHLYSGRPLQPWLIYVGDGERSQVLSGAYGVLPGGSVKVVTADKDLQEDALTFTWRGVTKGDLVLRSDGNSVLDLSKHLAADASLAFDMKVDDAGKGQVSVGFACGDNCRRQLSLSDYVTAHSGKGWQRVAVKLACFAKGENAATALQNITMPFVLAVEGDGELSLANIDIAMNAEQTLPCP